MKKKDLKKMLIPTLLATFYTIPALAGAEEAVAPAQPEKGKSRPAVAAQSVKQEVIQILRQGETDAVTLNIAGQPGVHFQVYYSATGAEDSYTLVPKGQGRIAENGMGSVSFAIGKLGKEEVYLKVVTSDSADFAETRIMPKPIVLEVEWVQVNERGINEIRAKIRHAVEKRKHDVRTPTAVAGVRG
jgi:hypothetical protein